MSLKTDLTLLVLFLLLFLPAAICATDTQLKTFQSSLYLNEERYFRTGSAVYFQSQGTIMASSPVLTVSLGGSTITVDLHESPTASGIYRGVFYTSRTETNDDNDTIKTYDGAVLTLSSDIDGDGVEGTTDVTNITIDDTPPTPPRWCRINATNNGSIIVKWTKYNGGDFGYYVVYRSENRDLVEPVEVVNVTDPLVTHIVDPQSNLISHTHYWYGVMVVDLAGNPSTVRISESSAVPYNDTTPPSQVTGVNATAPLEGNSINLTWNPSPEPDVVGYNIYHSTDPNIAPANKYLIAFVTRPGFVHRQISANENHYYIVVALDEEENPSPPSKVVNATPDDIIPPGPPVDLSVTTQPTGYMVLNWKPPSGEGVYKYNIYRSEQSGAEEFWNPYASTQDTTFTDTNVENGKTYFYVVRSSDRAGNEEKNTFEVAGTSVDQTPPRPPRGLKAEDTTLGRRIKLVWLPPGGEKPAEYRIYRSNKSGAENFSSPLAIVSSTDFTDRSVVDGVVYFYVVRSVDAAGNEENNTNEITVVSRDLTPPPPVTDVTATPQRGGIIAVSWLPPYADIKDPELEKEIRQDVDHYDVYWNTYEGFKPDPSKMMTTTNNYVVHRNLVDGRTYYYVVRSVDAAGNENTDDEKTSASAVADTKPPGAPKNLRTVRLKDGRILLEWDPPAGEAPYRYNIYRSTSRGAEDFSYPFAMTFSNTDWTDGNVTDGHWYYYVVRSADFLLNEEDNTNEVGNFSEDSLPPLPPSGLTITQMAGGSLMLNWTAPKPKPPSPGAEVREADLAVAYRVYSSTSPGKENFSRFIAETTKTFFVDTGLQDGTEYFYVVRSVDSAGNEDQNTFEVSATADASPPPAPIDVVARRSARGEVILTWTDPGGEPVMEYHIYKFIGNETAHFDKPFAVTRKDIFVDNDVSKTVQYRYVIRSVDRAGNEGRNTDEVLAPVLLGPPVNVTARALKGGNIEVSWDPPAGAGNSIREYRVYRSLSPGAKQQKAPWGTTLATRYVDMSSSVGGATQYMVDGQRYYYSVSAVDVFGNEGMRSDEVSAVSDSTPPNKPAELQAIPEPTGAVELRWITPAGERVAKYRIYRFTNPKYFNFYSPLAETKRIIYLDENTKSGTTYYYVVRSVDAAGNEEKNTDAVMVTAFDSPPGPPTHLKAEVRKNGSIVLTWSPPTGEPISFYEIYRAREPGNETFDEPYARVTVPTFDDNYVKNGVTYYYVVRAVDSTGNEEKNVNEVSAKSVDTEPPGPPVNLAASPAGTGKILLKWQRPEGEIPASYVIYRSKSPYFRPIAQNYVNKTFRTQYLDTGLPPGETYYYIVHSVDAVDNEDDNTNRVKATTAPAPPTDLSATANEKGEIALLWKPPQMTISSFRIYRSTKSGEYDFSKPIAELPYPSSSYIDTGLNYSQTYYYIVRSVGTAGAEETNMNEVSATSRETIPPAAPTGLRCFSLPSGIIRIEWKHPDPSDVSVFNIYRVKGAAGSALPKLLSSTNKTWFEDERVQSGSAYSYLVRAVDIHGNEEKNSNWISCISKDVVPPSPPVNLSAKSLPGGSIELMWSPPATVRLGENLTYRIYRAASGNVSGLILVSSTNRTFFTDTDLVNGREYFYLVRAVDRAGNEENNTLFVSAKATKSGPRVIFAGILIGTFLASAYGLDRRSRLTRAG